MKHFEGSYGVLGIFPPSWSLQGASQSPMIRPSGYSSSCPEKVEAYKNRLPTCGGEDVFFFCSLGAQNLYLFKGDWGVYLGCWGVYLGWPRNTIDMPGRLPSVAEWMIRGAHTPFLRIQTALFGIIWYIISYQLIYHIISRLFFFRIYFWDVLKRTHFGFHPSVKMSGRVGTAYVYMWGNEAWSVAILVASQAMRI